MVCFRFLHGPKELKVQQVVTTSQNVKTHKPKMPASSSMQAKTEKVLQRCKLVVALQVEPPTLRECPDWSDSTKLRCCEETAGLEAAGLRVVVCGASSPPYHRRKRGARTGTSYTCISVSKGQAQSQPVACWCRTGTP